MASLLLDSSALIELRRRAFLAWNDEPIIKLLKEKIEQGHCIILDVVYQEIMKNKKAPEAILLGSYKDKCHKFKEEIFFDSKEVFDAYTKNICPKNRESREALSALQEHNDAKIIAHAYKYNYPIVTGELFIEYRKEMKLPKTVKKVKIPNVCHHLGIKTISLYDFVHMLTKEAYEQKS